MNDGSEEFSFIVTVAAPDRETARGWVGVAPGGERHGVEFITIDDM